MLRWQARATAGRLEDAKPGLEVPLHALLDSERDAIVKLAEGWGEIDLSHRKLAHRGFRLDLVHASESTVLRVLTAAGMHLPGPPKRATQRHDVDVWVIRAPDPNPSCAAAPLAGLREQVRPVPSEETW
ncbi:hypothetical protein ABN034_33115 [Actinopolymorpha sp. B11F2]|uniref:hypothetical protein n=1 Tax=Actinopolymorpha sp. B11F2 TaxID=3160862 RepID=UPI0032E480CD